MEEKRGIFDTKIILSHLSLASCVYNSNTVLSCFFDAPPYTNRLIAACSAAVVVVVVVVFRRKFIFNSRTLYGPITNNVIENVCASVF